MNEEGTEGEVHEQLVKGWLVQLQHRQHDYLHGIPYHALLVIVKLKSDLQKREVVELGVEEEPYALLVYLQRQGFYERNIDVHKFLIIKVEVERYQLVKEGVAQDVKL